MGLPQLDAVQNRVEALIRQELVGSGFNLEEVRVCRGGGRTRVEVRMDREAGGILVGECADWNRRIGERIEAAGAIDEPYLLDVSSPGLQTPVRRPQQFRRLVGKNIRIRLKDDPAAVVEGRLTECDERGVVLAEKKGAAERLIGFDQIDSAVVLIGF